MRPDAGIGATEERFITDLPDAGLKSDIASLEFPFFSLSKTPQRSVHRYERGKIHIEVIPSAKGLPTVWDRGILIYAAAQLVKGIDLGRTPSRVLAITPYDLLKTTNGRGWHGGSDYKSLIDALDRLRGVTVKTTVCTGSQRSTYGFGLIEEYHFVDRDQSAHSLTITLCDWLYRALLNREVLTLEPEYFQLKGGLERRLYEIVRKHLGQQRRWWIDLTTLQLKTGSQAQPRRFRFEMRKLTENHLTPPLDRYLLSIRDGRLLAYPNSEVGRACRIEDALTALRSRKLVPLIDQQQLIQRLARTLNSTAPTRVIGNALPSNPAGENL